MSSNKYIPERIYVSKSALNCAPTNGAIQIAKKLNSKLKTETLHSQTPKRPSLSREKLYTHVKESLIICTRSKSANFIETFASPGKIAENIGVMGKIYYHCPLKCQFCYLDNSGRGTKWNRVYMDWDRFKEECIKENLVNKIALTVWSAISFYKEEALEKVPEKYKEFCDKKIRPAVLKGLIKNDNDAIKYLKENIKTFLGIKKGHKETKNKLSEYYDKNKDKELWINIGEYSELLSIDHITNFTKEIMKWIQEDNRLKFSFRTKCANIDNILSQPANNRLKITMNLNTQYVIDKYEIGTSSLDERIDAVNKIVTKGDIVTQLVIEPIIKYDDCNREYVDLIKRVKSEIDLTKIKNIKFGTVRYKKGLMTTIEKNIPTCDLFEASQGLVEPRPGDKRWRYSEDFRIEIYKKLISEFGVQYKDILGLAAEASDIWEKVGLESSTIHSDTVYQYPG